MQERGRAYDRASLRYGFDGVSERQDGGRAKEKWRRGLVSFERRTREEEPAVSRAHFGVLESAEGLVAIRA